MPALLLAAIVVVGTIVAFGARPDLLRQPPGQLALQIALWGACLFVFPAIGVGRFFPRRVTRILLAIGGVAMTLVATTGWPFADESLLDHAHGELSAHAFGAGGCVTMTLGMGVLLIAIGFLSGAFVERRGLSAVFWVGAGLSLMALNLVTWRGCSLRCPGCCNPELFAAEGEAVDVAALGLAAARDAHGLEGITVLGGEPLEQIEGVTALARHAAALGLGVIVFSGYTREEAEARHGFAGLWSTIDTLVDGRFEASVRDRERRFVGSTNQRVLHRTARYADPALWRGGKRVEIHVGAGDRLHVRGDPALARLVSTSARSRDPSR